MTIRFIVPFALAGIAAIGGGCAFSNPSPEEDRASMVEEALLRAQAQEALTGPVSLREAVRFALDNNFDLRAAHIEISYQEEKARGSMLNLLPRLQADISLDNRNHPDASYSESALTGGRSLDFSFSRDQTQYPARVALLWNVLDFGAGYLRARQTGEQLNQSLEQIRRLRQQTALDTAVAYWRAVAARQNAKDAAGLLADMEQQLAHVRAAREKKILAEVDATKRELALLSGMVDAERWIQAEQDAMRELAKAMGSRQTDFTVQPDGTEGLEALEALANGQLDALHNQALSCRPELFQSDAQARVTMDEARLAILQMAPNVNLSLAFEHNNDSHMMWNDWLTTGVSVSWNLLSLPARLSDKKAAKLQGEAIREKNLAMSAAILTQVGMALGEWRQAGEMHERMRTRVETRGALVESLAQAEKNNQARPADVMQERIRLLGEQAAVRMQEAEIRSALARLASALGLDIDVDGGYSLPESL